MHETTSETIPVESTGPDTKIVAESYDRQSRLPLGVVWTDQLDQLVVCVVCRQVAVKICTGGRKWVCEPKSLFGG